MVCSATRPVIGIICVCQSQKRRKRAGHIDSPEGEAEHGGYPLFPDGSSRLPGHGEYRFPASTSGFGDTARRLQGVGAFLWLSSRSL